jgi:YYY domain-containing protein
MLAVLGLFLLIEVVGLLAAPLAALVLGRLPGAGLGFAKVLGLLLVTWLVWIAGSLGIAPYGTPLIAGVLVLLGIAGGLAGLRLRALSGRLEAKGPRRRLMRLALPPDDKVRLRLFWGAEAVFAVTYALGVLLAGFAPDVWNTEKPMDMAFITAINASESFPPHDPWMSGETLNYYYLGHVALAWPIQLLGLRPDAGYLLGWGLLFALTATAVYTFAGTLWAAARETFERPPRGGPVFAGLVAAALVAILGNLAAVRTWLRAEDPPSDYAWFDPSRVIPHTINEFPSWSFVLGDLHAHVLALPFTVLAIGFALQVTLHGPRGDLMWRAVAEAFAAALAVGMLYAINTWSYPVAAGLLAAAVVVWLRGGAPRGYPLVWLGLVLVASLVLILPFVLDFDAETRGIGTVGAAELPPERQTMAQRRPFPDWLGDTALIYGVLLWPLAAAFAGRWLRARRRWEWLGWGGVAALILGLLLASVDLTGVLLLAIAAAAATSAALDTALSPPARFLWLLIAGGVLLLLIPEVLYLRDAFDGSALARQNTVFKAGFQAYLLLGLAAACALPWAGKWLPRHVWTGWAAVAAVLLVLGLVFPYAGSYARTGGFATGPTLDGLRWLEARSPGDPGAIAWLRENADGDAVILEAFGDDYSAFGHARISTFTGRPTVMGWAGHELQWQHDPGTRGADVQTLYATTDVEAARRLIGTYGIRYVVAGPIEQTTYGDAGSAKWDQLGRRVFSQDGTTVWELR